MTTLTLIANRQQNNARFKVNQSYARLNLVKNLTGTPIIIARETGKNSQNNN